MPTLRIVSIAALIVAYAALMHYVNAGGQAPSLGAALAILPFLLVGLGMCSRRRTRIAGLALLAITAVAAWAGWPLLRQHAAVVFWLQDVGLMLTLLISFAQSLLPGRKPLCVTFAEMAHGPVPAAHERYARNITVAWAVFFGFMAAVSTLLFFLAPLAVWSIFANFLSLPLIALMFIGEFALRQRVLADLPPSHVLDGFRAYLRNSARAH